MIAAKNNPFAAGRIRRIGYISHEPSFERIEARLKQLDYTAAIVGPHGSGKSTLLRHLEPGLSQRSIPTTTLFINLDTKLPWKTIQNAVRSTPPKGVLLFDGANHLPFIRFRQLKFITQKRNIGLIITSHHEGLLPTLTNCSPSLDLLSEITQRLLPKHQTIDRSHLVALLDSHKGNIRDCLWQLYDQYTEQSDFRAIKPFLTC